jgi:hypothetical protein
MLLLEHPLSSYVQKVKVGWREKDIPFTVEIPQDLLSIVVAAHSDQRTLVLRCR